MNRSITFVLLLLLLASCGKSANVKLPRISSSTFQRDQQLSEKLFFIGPAIDSSKVEIVAECDCCASDFAFLTDSTFVYVSYCVHGDEYFKGKYIAFNNSLILKFDARCVRTTWDIADSDTSDLKETTTVANDGDYYNAFMISKLKSKTVISTCYEGSCEYGLENQSQSLTTLIRDLKKLGIWKLLMES